MRYFRLYAIGALVVFGAASWGWFKYDLATNYTPVPGTVVETDETCHLEKTDNFIVVKHEHSTNDVPCSVAEAAVQPGQKFEGYKIKPKTTIHYSYTSPVDHALHSGETWRDGAPDKWPAAGAPHTVYAHRKNADKSKFVT